MRKSLITLTAAAIVLVPVALSAQSADATVRARVYAPLTIASSGGNVGGGVVDLGIVITTAGGTLSIPASNAASAVLFTVGGQASVPITVTTTVNALTGPGAPIALTPNWLHASTNTNPGGAGASSLPGSVTLSAAGAYYMWLGGQVTVPAGQTAGTYSGIVNVAVAYQ